MKRTFGFFIFCILIIASLAVTASAALTGDVDGNGKIDFEDYVTLRLWTDTGASLTSEQADAADVYPDGVVDEKDVNTLYSLILGSGYTESEGLAYDLHYPEHDSYDIIGIGSCTDKVIVIPKEIDGLPVSSIVADAFRDNTDILGVVFTEKVKEIGWNAFDNCVNLKKIILPSTVTDIYNYAFQNCTSLCSVSFSEGLKHIDHYAFYGCTSLESVELPDTLDFIGDYIFMNSGLKNIKFGSSMDIGYMMFAGTPIESITIPGTVRDVGGYSFENCTELTEINLCEGIETVSSGAFSGCAKLKSITFPASVYAVGANMLGCCTSLEEIKVADGNENVSAVGNCLLTGDGYYLMAGCKNSVIPDTVGVIQDSAFYGCTGLISLTVPYGVSQIYPYAFAGCTGLTELKLADSLTRIRGCAFIDCSSLKEITLPESLEQIDDDILSGCTSLESITMLFFGQTAYATSNVFLNRVFDGTVPESLKNVCVTKSDTIMYNALRFCSDIETVTLCEPTSGIEETGMAYMSNLTTVTIPITVKKIGERAFAYDSSLQKILYMGNISDWNAIEKGENWNMATGSYEIFCFDGKISK